VAQPHGVRAADWRRACDLAQRQIRSFCAPPPWLAGSRHSLPGERAHARRGVRAVHHIVDHLWAVDDEVFLVSGIKEVESDAIAPCEKSTVAGGIGGLAGGQDLVVVPGPVGPTVVDVGEAVHMGELRAGERLPRPAGHVGVTGQCGDSPPQAGLPKIMST